MNNELKRTNKETAVTYFKVGAVTEPKKTTNLPVLVACIRPRFEPWT
jgi:hypothetical protein